MASNLSNTLGAKQQYIELKTSMGTFKVLVESPLNFEQTAERLGSIKGSLSMRSHEKGTKVYYSVVESTMHHAHVSTPNVASAISPKPKPKPSPNTPCPFGKNCRYGVKCIYMHPKTESGSESGESVVIAGPSAPV